LIGTPSKPKKPPTYSPPPRENQSTFDGTGNHITPCFSHREDGVRGGGGDWWWRLLRLPIGADAPPQPTRSSHGEFPSWYLCPNIMIPMSRPPQHQAHRIPSPSSTHLHPLVNCPDTTATVAWYVCDRRP
jgi:hypothetical protein